MSRSIVALRALLDRRAGAPDLSTSRSDVDTYARASYGAAHTPRTGNAWLVCLPGHGVYDVPGHGRVEVKSLCSPSADGSTCVIIRGGLAVAFVHESRTRFALSVRPLWGATCVRLHVQWIEPGSSDLERRRRRHETRRARASVGVRPANLD